MEGIEEEEDEEDAELSPSSLQKMTTTLEISMISANGYKSRHSQPECGYALEPSQWTEYSIHTMDPDNLELTFEFFEVIQFDTIRQTSLSPCGSLSWSQSVIQISLPDRGINKYNRNKKEHTLHIGSI